MPPASNSHIIESMLSESTMSHAIVQRKYINLHRPLLINLDFACQPYPQFVSKSHDTMVLSCTLALLSSLVGHLEPNNRIASLVVDWVVSLVFNGKTSPYTLGFV
jgi:hypothetical protein